VAGTAVEELVTPPAARDLLSAWELGLPCSIPQRGVVLLGALFPRRSVDDLLGMSLSERDERLLEGHRLLFGPRLSSVVTCPSCSVELELDLSVDDLLVSAEGDEAAGELEVEADGWVVRGRPLSVRDVLDAAALDADGGRALLLSRSIDSVTPSGESKPALGCSVSLPTEVEEAFLAELGRRNPTGALDIEQTCPDCAHVWTTPFDAVGCLWAEIHGWAQRMLREVHSLARAYGWRESDILALSPMRRAEYLDMAGHG
jgi:hypothetical protein